MKLQFKYQKFQQDAANTVCDIFMGQPYGTFQYKVDSGNRASLYDTGWKNRRIELNDDIILSRVQDIQRKNMIVPSKKLEGRYNFTIEMETGVGKTYTYIKTIFELNKRYGWSKFIVIVPSIAIREGVYKTFQVTQDHFAMEYNKKIDFFIYNSKQIARLEDFATSSSINVMIINSQAFNANGKDARRIYMELDEFRSRVPIEVIAETNPILIIDEPQSVEGKKTKEALKDFNPLFTLRYSATHKKDSIYNMVYKLDAIDAYNQKLVKKITVKGITQSGTTGTEGYLYLDKIKLSKAAPKAIIEFDVKKADGVIRNSVTVGEGYNLYENSGNLDEYKDGYVVKEINGKDEYIELLNGKRIYVDKAIGEMNEEQIRRVQIHETILSHIERERHLFRKGIKVLSLFFIDEVAHYKWYDEAGQAQNGIFAKMFEEEYTNIINHLQLEFYDEEYLKYLDSIDVKRTHAGYFSVDKKGHMINGKISKKEKISDDVDVYDLIMKDKERLLSFEEPVRFIFSHSALKEGWDNSNVFQICTLKQSNSDVRKRQEVGRGLRLCVNKNGERMDEAVLDRDVHNVNVLTIIASESYDSFARGLQTEIAENIDRPSVITEDLFVGKIIENINGDKLVIDKDMAHSILFDLVISKYIDKKGVLTDKYHNDLDNKEIKLSEEVQEYAPEIINIINSVYDEKRSLPIENARDYDVDLKLDKNKMAMPEFKALWSKINTKTVYEVHFNTNELIKKAISNLNVNLRVANIYFKIETGSQTDRIESKEDLLEGKTFVKEDTKSYNSQRYSKVNNAVKYDLVGKLVKETNLTRKDIIAILTGIEKNVFNMFKNNPEEFIIKAARIINDAKATTVIEHISYESTNNHYDIDIFNDNMVKGKRDVNSIKVNKHLYDYVVYDSNIERKFAEDLDTDRNVAVYVKLPNSFFISTPVGKYNPDWAIAFYEGTVKHIYFVAETKGSMSSLQLRLIEDTKIKCARKHFAAISKGDVVYDVIDSYDKLLKVLKS